MPVAIIVVRRRGCHMLWCLCKRNVGRFYWTRGGRLEGIKIENLWT